jgi:hypothetical protein
MSIEGASCNSLGLSRTESSCEIKIEMSSSIPEAEEKEVDIAHVLGPWLELCRFAGLYCSPSPLQSLHGGSVGVLILGTSLYWISNSISQKYVSSPVLLSNFIPLVMSILYIVMLCQMREPTQFGTLFKILFDTHHDTVLKDVRASFSKEVATTRTFIIAITVGISAFSITANVIFSETINYFQISVLPLIFFPSFTALGIIYLIPRAHIVAADGLRQFLTKLPVQPSSFPAGFLNQSHDQEVSNTNSSIARCSVTDAAAGARAPDTSSIACTLQFAIDAICRNRQHMQSACLGSFWIFFPLLTCFAVLTVFSLSIAWNVVLDGGTNAWVVFIMVFFVASAFVIMLTTPALVSMSFYLCRESVDFTCNAAVRDILISTPTLHAGLLLLIATSHRDNFSIAGM